MTEKNKIKKIDAKDQILGRLASEIARYLMGKDDPAFQRHNIDASSEVYVFNADSIKFSGDKINKKIYFRHSGYPGGIKSTNLEKMMEKDSREVLKKAINGMLPKNKLRPKMLKKLRIYKGEIELS